VSSVHAPRLYQRLPSKRVSATPRQCTPCAIFIPPSTVTRITTTLLFLISPIFSEFHIFAEAGNHRRLHVESGHVNHR